MSSYLVTKLYHAALGGFDLRQVEGDVSVELLEERDSITDQDRQNRITNFVGQPATKALRGDCRPSDNPDGTEPGPQAPVHKLRQIARIEFDGIPDARQVPTREDEGRFVAISPTEPLAFKTKRGLIGPRSHDIAV